jgi:hypothetical protein
MPTRQSFIARCSAMLLLAAGCNYATDRSEHPRAAEEQISDSHGFAVVGKAAAPPAPQPADASAAGDLGQVRQVSDSMGPRMIVRNGSATIEVARLDSAMARVREMAQRAGGYVANTALASGRDEVPSATIEVRVPAAQFDVLLASLEPLGRVSNVHTTSEDVGEEFVDVSARLENARRLEQRIQNLLATRTGKLDEVLAAERELARVRELIERYEGRVRFLRARTAMSTLSVTVHEPYPVVGGPGSGPIAQAFKQLWRNFVFFNAALIASLGWLLPGAALVMGSALLLRRVWRLRRAA